MGSYKKTIITDAGMNLLARVSAGETTLEFTRVCTISHEYTSDEEVMKLTVAEGEEQTAAPSGVYVTGDTLVNVRAAFENSGIIKEYMIWAVGIYAADGESELLFALSRAVNPDLVPAFNGVAPSAFVFNIQLAISRASSLSITVSQEGVATVQDVEELRADLDEVKKDTESIRRRVERLGGGINLTLLQTKWYLEGGIYKQVAEVVEIRASDAPVIGLYLQKEDMEESKSMEKAFSFVYSAETEDGRIIFYARKKPETDIPVCVKGA